MAADQASIDRGAALLEFTLVAGMFLTLLLVLFDVSRFFAARMILLDSAQKGLAIMAKTPSLQVDFFRHESQSSLMADTRYQEYNTSRLAISQQIGQLVAASGFIAPPGSNRAIELVPVTAYDEYENGAVVVNNLPVAILRPGETFYSSLLGRYVNHPQICSSMPDAECGNPRKETDSMESLLRANPMIVFAQARVQTILFGTIPLSVASVGYSQRYPDSVTQGKDYLPGEKIEEDVPEEPACVRPENTAGCSNWSDYWCDCCDTRSCPDGQRWDSETCRCTDCQLSRDSCPTTYGAWGCFCGCPEGYSCPEGGFSNRLEDITTVEGVETTCSNCIDLRDNGGVGT